MAPEVIRELFVTAFQDFESYCQSIAAPDTDAQRRRQDAHKLRGSASSLGLCAVAELAGRIEQATDDPRAVELSEQLRQALIRTRVELIERGLLSEHG